MWLPLNEGVAMCEKVVGMKGLVEAGSSRSQQAWSIAAADPQATVDPHS